MISERRSTDARLAVRDLDRRLTGDHRLRRAEIVEIHREDRDADLWEQVNQAQQSVHRRWILFPCLQTEMETD